MSLFQQLALLVAFIGSCPSLIAAPAHPGSKGPVQEKTVSYQSAGRRIIVESFLPATTQPVPAVLVLYGSGGVVFGKKDITALARQLAEKGYAAYLVHYLNRTGSIVEWGDSGILKHWPEWTETVRDGVDFVCTQPGVNRHRIGLFGYSLGAFLAIAESTDDPRIGAVAELSGGLFEKEKGHTRRFPPMLIMHGTADERVPEARVPELRAEARRFGKAPEVKIYQGEAHQLSPAAYADATTRTLAFFDRHLRH